MLSIRQQTSSNLLICLIKQSAYALSTFVFAMMIICCNKVSKISYTNIKIDQLKVYLLILYLYFSNLISYIKKNLRLLKKKVISNFFVFFSSFHFELFFITLRISKSFMTQKWESHKLKTYFKLQCLFTYSDLLLSVRSLIRTVLFRKKFKKI